MLRAKKMIEDVFRLRDLNNAYNSYEELCVLANYIINSGAEQIVLDCAAVDFVASNLFAVLGCLFAEKLNGKKLRINNVKEPLQKIIQKSGFYRHFKGLSGLPDKYNTIIPYRVFNVMDIEQYEKYLTIELFARDDLPVMSRGVKDSIKDYLLEVFNNVNDHTECKHIYTCGQYFPKMGMLYFTLADSGKTIYENVYDYHVENNKSCPKCCLEWAMKSGNTTAKSETPRGIGLHLINNFVKLNEGELFIISNDEIYEITDRKEAYLKLKHAFPGTVVTLAFNLSDRGKYRLKSENVSEIEF